MKKVKVELTEELLIQEKTVNKMTVKQIAEKYGWSEPTVMRKLRFYGIKYPRKDIKSKISKEQFYQMYYVDNLSLKEILAKYDTKHIVRLTNMMKEWGFSIRTDSRTGPQKSFAERRRSHPYLYGAVLSDIKYGAKVRSLEFSITLDDVWFQITKQNHKCALTGDDISFPRNNKDYMSNNHIASVDRIDSSLGYTPSNIQIVRNDINMMKLRHSQSDFIELCHKVSRFATEAGL